MPKTPIAKTGYTAGTADKYVIDAAVVYTGLEYSAEGGFVGNLIGATTGGVTVTIEPTYRDIEVDGARHVKAKGNTVLQSTKGTVLAHFKELTAETLKLAINGTLRDATIAEAPAGYKVIETKRYITAGDYIDNIAFVGRISGTDKPIIAILDNVLTTSALPLATEDGKEVVIDVTFEAYATYDQISLDKYPWRIFYPEVA